MIKVFLPNDTDYSSNGESTIKPIEAVITKKSDEEYLTMEAPLKYAGLLVQDNILIVDTLTGKKGYRIHNPVTTDTITVQAWICYQEYETIPEDRNIVIAHGKNLDECKVSETWDDVVTKIIPVGYKKMKLPEEYISVVHTYPRDFEKTIEFDMSEDLEPVLDTLEETISIMKSLETAQKNSVAALQAKHASYDVSITSLQEEKVRQQQRLAQLGDSEAELKEKATIEAALPLIDKEVTSLTTEKADTLAALDQANKDLTKASQDVVDTQTQYNDIIINDLRSQAQTYLNANQYPKISYDLQANLQGILEIGDTVRVKHPKMRVDLLTQVTEYSLDCLTMKFTQVKFGTPEITLKTKFLEIDEKIDGLSKEVDHSNGTVSKYYSEYKRDNEGMVSKFIEELYGSVGGLFGMISKSTSTFRQTASEISGTVERVNANLSSDIASISLKADQIALTVQHNYTDLDGKITVNSSKITQTATEIRSEVSQTFKSYSTTTQMNSAISQSATSIMSTVSTQIDGVEDHVSTVEQTANKISWLVKSGTSASDFTLTDRAITLVSQNINLTGYVTITSLKTAGSVEIDGGNIKANTITADSIKSGGTITGVIFTNGYVTIDANNITINGSSGYVKGKQTDGTIVELIGFSGNNSIYIGKNSYSASTSYLYMKQRTIEIGYSSGFYENAVSLLGNVSLGSSGKKIGFFGSSPVAKQTVDKVSSAVALTTLAARFNTLLTALNTMGFINASSTS